MIFKFDKNQLKFVKISNVKLFLYSLLIISVHACIFWAYGFFVGKKIAEKEIILSEEEKIILINESDKFTKEKFVAMLNELKVNFPHIVYAQSLIETGGWKSRVFIENHNLFGMKEAKRRITTAGGTQNNHAYYNHWRESVYDYAFYQCRYLHNIKTEQQYFEYLSATYAQDSSYVEKVKKISNSNNVKKLFY
jgi:uncharacterized FlgJ-related protein